MEKRAFERIPAVIDFHCFNMDCFGIITNISANGMFIKSNNMSFPFETKFKLCIPVKERKLNIKVRVNRITKSTGYYDGIAVELVNPSKKYLEFFTGIRSSDKPWNVIHS